MTVEGDAAPLDALRAAEIRPKRQGAARTHRLSVGQHQLYRWILRQFAAANPPTGAATHAAAGTLGLDATDAFRVLASEDLVHFDPTGRPIVAYPFSAEPRGHRVLIDGERLVEAMCAIDALGMAPMLNVSIEINSPDPLTKSEIWVRLDPGDGAWWEPDAAVVLDGCVDTRGPSFRSCCTTLNFFESGESALSYLVANPGVSGQVISVQEAIELGRYTFGDLLTSTEA